MKVYEHNGGNFNALVYVFMRRWNLPEIDGHTFTKDSWLAIPAQKTETDKSISYSIINARIQFSALLIVADNGHIIQANRERVDNKVPVVQMRRIKFESFSVPAWELDNNAPWPYANMFKSDLVKQRYDGTEQTAYFSTNSEDELYTSVRKAVSRKPCNCGKVTYVG